MPLESLVSTIVAGCGHRSCTRYLAAGPFSNLFVGGHCPNLKSRKLGLWKSRSAARWLKGVLLIFALFKPVELSLARGFDLKPFAELQCSVRRAKQIAVGNQPVHGQSFLAFDDSMGVATQRRVPRPNFAIRERIYAPGFNNTFWLEYPSFVVYRLVRQTVTREFNALGLKKSGSVPVVLYQDSERRVLQLGLNVGGSTWGEPKLVEHESWDRYAQAI